MIENKVKYYWIIEQTLDIKFYGHSITKRSWTENHISNLKEIYHVKYVNGEK